VISRNSPPAVEKGRRFAVKRVRPNAHPVDFTDRKSIEDGSAHPPAGTKNQKD
jgi:hypothetical protein